MTDLREALDRFLETAAYAAKLRATRRLETRLQRKLSQSFRREGRTFLAAFRRFAPRFPKPAGVLEAIGKAWEKAALAAARREAAYRRAALLEVYVSGVDAGMAAGSSAFGDLAALLELPNPRAVAWVKAHGLEAIRDLDDVTMQGLRAIIANATDEGWSYVRTAKRIGEEYAMFSRTRALRIAVHETSLAYEKGNRLVADLMAAHHPVEKAWFTAGDNRVDEEMCGPNEADGWIPLEQEFSSGDSEAPAHVGCRCNCGYQVIGTGAAA